MMTELEKELITKIIRASELMTEIERAKLIGYGEAVIDMREGEKKSA